MLLLGPVEFAARRVAAQDEAYRRLLPPTRAWVARMARPEDLDTLSSAILDLYDRVYRDEGGEGTPSPDSLWAQIEQGLDAATAGSSPELIATWLSTAVTNAATTQAALHDPEPLALEWVTMRDSAVRAEHREVAGQVRGPTQPFDVCGTQMLYPGQPVGPVGCWINCRCAVRPVAAQDRLVAAGGDRLWHREDRSEQGAAMTTVEIDRPAAADTSVQTPWFGVLAPEGVPSGDGRMFAENALTHRDLPLPLTWQKASSEGHLGSVTVAKIERIWREDGLMKAEGYFLSTPEADEVVALIAEFGRYGVSVDAVDAVAEFGEDEVVFTSAQISSASIVSIPAFAQAWVALGTWEGAGGWATPSEQVGEVDEPDAEDAPCSCDPADENYREDCDCVDDEDQMPFREVSTEERDRLAEEGKALPDGSFPIANCEDLRNAIQAIGRAKDPAEAKAHIRSRKSDLGCNDVPLPDTWSLAPSFAKDLAPGVTEDGPGWLTHPVDTDRLRDYWVSGAGAAQIDWGTPGDFNRCRVATAEYVKPQYLSGYCANRHYDALGYWPGQAPHAGDTVTTTASSGPPAPSLTLTAAAPRPVLPGAWFADPGLSGPTAFTVDDDGRVFGHLATWGVCHIGFNGECVEAPHSIAEYAYFTTGVVVTDQGPVPVGSVTMGGGHAAAGLGWRPAIDHYDSTSTVVADVAAGEDEHGIWVAGALRDGVTDEQVAELRASGGLSGDWREVRRGSGELELVAALAVNVGGYPVPRIQVAASAGRCTTLVAAGVITAEDPVEEIVRRVHARVREDQQVAQAQERLRAALVGPRLDVLRARLEQV